MPTHRLSAADGAVVRRGAPEPPNVLPSPAVSRGGVAPADTRWVLGA